MATPEGRTRGPYRNTEARRREIIAAAQQVFATSGFRAGSLRDIGVLVGIDPSSILHHFPTKEALLQAVLDDKDAHDMEGVPSIGQIDPAGFPREVLRLAQRNELVPDLIALYAILSAESTTAAHPSAEYFRERTDRVRRDFGTAFQLMADAGLLADGITPEYAARSTFAIWDGIQIHWLIEPDAVSVTQTLHEHLRLITKVSDF